ncbi:MAG TPA: MEKHLA domain-containing protein [Mariprofundaceae bacterium]|nr:MEKHLA domain-containing protein [Mariprofundaceae bacterium]
MIPEFPEHLSDHVALLADSFTRLTGRRLLENTDARELARRIWEAPFALVSHGAEADPVFNYANLTALRLFEMGWDAFTHLPSRLSAEPDKREARAALLQRVSEHGYIDDYAGVRISATGRRFVIRDAVVWNVIDRQGHCHGQAAMFARWSDAG